MSRFPKIDSPCPLPMDEQCKLDGHCGYCGKQVHRLDGMDEAQRRALLASAEGPICVSYRVPARRKVGRFGAAIAATLMTTSAAAYAQNADSAAVAGSSETLPQRIVAQTEPSDQEVVEMVFVGGVDDPQNASDVVDESLAALPMRAAPPQHSPVATDTVLPGHTENVVIVVGGGVSDPAQAEWLDADDSALPSLPMIVAASDDDRVGD